MTEDVGKLSGEQLAAISREMVRIKAGSYGRGADSAKTYQNDNFILCTLRGGFTTIERTLIDHDDEDLVRQVRLRYQSKMEHSFTGAVERITGRKVLAYQSQVLFDPDYSIEIFVLGGSANVDAKDRSE